MARIVSKTNWQATQSPAPSDFNRIENNNEQAFTELDAEVSTRASADTALQANINTEASTRAGADTTLQNNINDETAARIAGDNNLNAIKMAVFQTGDGDGQIGYWSNDSLCELPAGGTWFFYVTRFVESSGRQYGEAGIAGGGTTHASYTNSSGFYIRLY